MTHNCIQLFALAIVFVFMNLPLVGIAQERPVLAQSALPTTAATTASSPFINKWALQGQPGYTVRFIVKGINPDGSVDLEYTSNNNPVRITEAKIQGGRLKVRGGNTANLEYDLEYSSALGGMLHGSRTQGSYTNGVKFYPEK